MTHKPDKAFILAAGKGTRLRPWTDTMPKPMVPVAGRSIIDHTLAKLDEAGVTDVMVNLHHLSEVLETHLKKISRPHISYSHEDELLNTGGGVKKVLPFFEQRPFYLINGDAFWTEGESGAALERLCAAWDPDKMDILLLLQPVDAMTLTQGVGDYTLETDGKAKRSHEKTGPYMFAGIRIAVPSILEPFREDCFSFLSVMDEAEARGRLYGLVHDGAWHHISTAQDLERVNEALAAEAAA